MTTAWGWVVVTSAGEPLDAWVQQPGYNGWWQQLITSPRIYATAPLSRAISLFDAITLAVCLTVLVVTLATLGVRDALFLSFGIGAVATLYGDRLRGRWLRHLPVPISRALLTAATEGIITNQQLWDAAAAPALVEALESELRRAESVEPSGVCEPETPAGLFEPYVPPASPITESDGQVPVCRCWLHGPGGCQ